MRSLDHKTWLDNEYSQWVKALAESTAHNFKEHPMVKRMLGEVDPYTVFPIAISGDEWNLIKTIDEIGFKKPDCPTPNAFRMVYYGQKILRQSPTAIVEIGGGCGEQYAILRALGYKGTYWIYDLYPVFQFQNKYLTEVNRLTGLDTSLTPKPVPDFCMSMYALGEFDDETKTQYIESVVKKCPHGLIVWNGHSGASNEINFKCKIEDENPMTSPGNLLLTW